MFYFEIYLLTPMVHKYYARQKEPRIKSVQVVPPPALGRLLIKCKSFYNILRFTMKQTQNICLLLELETSERQNCHYQNATRCTK